MNSLNQNSIDVVIPVYNGAEFIIDALKSVVEQTLSPNKIIVVNDGSTDDTQALVSEYAKTSRIEIKIITKTNGGLSSARNAGIKESNADLVAFLDADDMWLKNKLEKQLNVYQNTPFQNLALVYCDYDVMDSKGVIKYKNYKAPLDKKTMRGVVFNKLLERNQITGSGSAVLIRRQVFEDVGLFDENLRFAEDWDMWLRISEKYEVDFSPEVLVHIRKHKENMTYDPSKTFVNELEFYKKWIPKINGRYPIPLFWADKVTFRILTSFPKHNFKKILEDKFSDDMRKKLFRKTFGSFYLYIPMFLFRQIFNMIFYPNYFRILIGLMKYKGR